jgi:hypothetical protein
VTRGAWNAGSIVTIAAEVSQEAAFGRDDPSGRTACA